ncbi:MAG: hypothetical protein AAGC65_04520 [Mucilaginibacter sp.]|uniref:hypothetical protein n=1 Tax=Mucilaginibacter sp. TaxID=1882438 RepID=UPI00319F5398
MKYLFYLVILLSQAPLFSHAQSNYKPGYVVNSKNDTLKGFIDYREWNKNPKEVNFKQNLAASPQKFTPVNANAFAITDAEYYEKFIVKISTSEIQPDKLSLAPDTAYVTDTVFLKNLVNGKTISLYEFTNSQKSSFYILDKLTRQINYLKQYLFYADDQQSVSNLNIYNNQLTRLAYEYQPGNKKLLSHTRVASYSESSLKAVAIELNGGNATQQAVHSSSGIRFFAGAGIRYSKLQFNSPTGAGPFSNGMHDSYTSPVLTAGVDFLANKYTEKIAFRFEFQAAAGSYQFSENYTNVYDTQNSLAIKQFHLSAIPQIIYNFYNADKLKVFIDLGAAMNVFKYNNYDFVISRTFGGTTSVDRQNKYPDLENFTVSFPIKGGVRINKCLELYGAYYLPASVTRYSFFSAAQSSIQVGANYIFR